MNTQAPTVGDTIGRPAKPAHPHRPAHPAHPTRPQHPAKPHRPHAHHPVTSKKPTTAKKAHKSAGRMTPAEVAEVLERLALALPGGMA